MPLCPICKKPVAVADKDKALNADAKRYYPFCSDRCKLIDLGRWLDGAYQIPVTAPQDDEETGDPRS